MVVYYCFVIIKNKPVIGCPTPQFLGIHQGGKCNRPVSIVVSHLFSVVFGGGFFVFLAIL